MWPNRRLIELLNIEIPIVQAPVAGAMDWELAAAAAEAGALGSLPCAMLNPDQTRALMAKIRAHTGKPGPAWIWSDFFQRHPLLGGPGPHGGITYVEPLSKRHDSRCPSGPAPVLRVAATDPG